MDTLVAVGEDGHHKNVLQKQEQIVVVSEPQSQFLGHLTPSSKTAESICQALVEFLSSKDAILDVKVLGADSTSTNTGHNGGVLRRFEAERRSRVHYSICMLHTNELPLRHLIVKLDGPTSGHNSFHGVIGESLMKMESLEWNEKFKRIRKGPDLPELPTDVFDSLSADQRYLYLAAVSIKKGRVEEKLLHLKPDPVNHSGWLTTACRLMALHLKKHGLDAKAKRNLYTLVFFVVTNYVPCWFAIKLRPHISNASSHVLLAVQLLRLLPKTTRTIVQPYVKSWHAHPENLLVPLLCSEDTSDRNFAVEKILKLRNESDVGDSSPRIFLPPPLNFKARSLVDLIDWKEVPVTESRLTSDLTLAEINDLRETPLQVPPYPCHTQAVERMIRELTDVAQRVAGSEARDGYLKSRMASRAQYKDTTTKRDFTRMVKTEDYI